MFEVNHPNITKCCFCDGILNHIKKIEDGKIWICKCGAEFLYKGAEITRKKFKEATGRNPENDDLERVNCPDAGKIGHRSCGWCKNCNLPVFECFCEVERKENGTYRTIKRHYIL